MQQVNTLEVLMMLEAGLVKSFQHPASVIE